MLVKVLIFPYYKLMVNYNKGDIEMVETVQEENAPVQPEENTGPMNFSDAMKQAMAGLVAQEETGKDPDRVQNVGIMITLLKGDRVISDLIQLTPEFSLRLASLNGRHLNFIHETCSHDTKKDEEGKPIYNEKLSYNLSIALMLFEINGKRVLDPFDAESGIVTMHDLWDELDARTKVLTAWPPEWMRELALFVEDFIYQLALTTSEKNIEAF